MSRSSMQSSSVPGPTVDVNVPRFNQAVIAAALSLAFVLDIPAIVGLAAAVLTISAVAPRWAPLSRLYTGVVRPRRSAGAIEVEDARPPRFAQQLGAGFTILATVALAAGTPLIGWALALLVAALAFLAATSRICIGCIIYERWVA